MTPSTDPEDAREEPLDTEAMLRAELAHVLDESRWTDLPPLPLERLIRELHARPDDERPTALCLSGGGIRSATFCLGVLQWLAGHRQLQDFHYLSTVSGGGYIGSWLVNGLWQAARPVCEPADAEAEALIEAAKEACDRAATAAEQDASPANLAVVAANAATLDRVRRDAQAMRRAAAAQGGVRSAEWLHRVGQSAGSVGAASAAGAARTVGDAIDPVAPLRAFSNYLSPTGGLSGDAFSLGAIFVRNLLLNALVWLPLLAALVALPRLYIAVLAVVPMAEWVAFVRWGCVGLAWLAIVGGVVYIVADLPAPRDAPMVPTAPTAQARQDAAQAAAASVPFRDRFFWFCFLPIVVAAILLSIGGAWIATLRNWPWWIYALAGALAHLLGVVVGVPARIARGHRKRRSSVWGVIAVVLVGAFGGALASVALVQMGVDPDVGAAESQRLVYASLAVPAMTGAFWLAMALYAGLMGRFTDEQDREWWARATAAWLKFSLLWVAAFALVVWLPLPIFDQFGSSGPTAVQFGIGGGALGILTSLIGYWSKNGGDLQRKAQGFLRVTRMKLLDAMAAAVVLTTLLALSMGWSAALDRCHGWTWTAPLCAADLHAQTDFMREQKRLRADGGNTRRPVADAAAAGAASDAIDDDGAEPGRSSAASVYRHVLLEADGRMLTVAIGALMAFAAALALLMGINVFSLHGMYGNRLVRAYLGSGRAQRHPHWFTGFDPVDNPALAALAAPLPTAGGQPRLYPLINIALNIVRPTPQHLDWQQRKAAPFIATPLHCGAATVGYRPTARYAGGVSLGRALTISGAAASPNMGYHSSPLVTFVMTLFNVRLGWWSPNPGLAGGKVWKLDQPWIGIDIAMAEAFGSTGVDDRFVYLSDGGHFDNLGIYEMVRRRCRRIVAVDATCDGSFKWADLLEVVRKIRVDLGIPIELPAVLPPADDPADTRRIEARIRYSARDGNDCDRDGTLIVLKPRLRPKQDPPELAAYAAASAADGSPPKDPARFPHQSTADQFFDERQFESYRLLGYVTAADALGASGAAAEVSPADGAATTTAAALAGAAAQDGGAVSPIAGGLGGAAGAGGFGHFIEQMGSGAALATALTIGGTLGVAGTVALAPAEVTLSSADRALLKDGLSLRVDGGTLKLNDNDRQMLVNGIRVNVDGAALEGPARRLTSAAEDLTTAATKLGGLTNPASPSASGATTLVADASLRKLATDLQLQIRLLRERMEGGASAPEVARAVLVIEKRLETIETRLPSDANGKALNDALNGIKSALMDLKPSVDGIAPRRNVRGQDGGNR